MAELKLKVLGTRGSMAVDGADYAEFGGATSCYMVSAGEETVFLDAGSGLTGAEVDFPNPPVILLSHLHLDHLLGLGMYPRLSKKGLTTRIYVPTEGEEDAETVINRLYSPPFWPVSLKIYAGDVRIEPLRFPIRVGEIEIDGMEGSHPGGCVVMKLSYRKSSIVYMSDFEHGEEFPSSLKDFINGASLLLYDGQYEEEEYLTKKGFGHSTVNKGIELMETAKIPQMLIVHHDPASIDRVLSEREAAIGRADVRFARQGECITLEA